jgi:hypothetical protein
MTKLKQNVNLIWCQPLNTQQDLYHETCCRGDKYQLVVS